MTTRSLAAHVFAGALVALALAFVSLVSTAGHGTAYARPLRMDGSMMGHATVDGIPAPPAGCAIGDSWCAFCVANPAVPACTAFPPAHVSGQSTSAPPARSGNNPVPGVTTGGLVPSAGVSLQFVGFWRSCTMISGNGVVWTPASLPPPPGARC